MSAVTRLSCRALAALTCVQASCCFGQSPTVSPPPTSEVIAGGMPATLIDGATAETTPKIEVKAGKEEKRAALSFGNALSRGTQWVAKLCTGWDDESSETALGTLDGLDSGFKLELEMTRSFFSPPSVKELNLASLDSACAAARASLNEPKSECDDTLYDRVTDRRVLRQISEAYFANKPYFPFATLSAAAGHDEFEYLDAQLSSETTKETGWSIGLSGGVLHVVNQWSILVGYRRESAYADDKQSSATVCSPIPETTALSCKDGFLRPPKETEKDVATLEWRQQWPELTAWKIRPASSLRLSYDFDSNERGISLPIYIVGDAKGGLAGGIQFGWSDEDEGDDFEAAIFVSSPFVLKP